MIYWFKYTNLMICGYFFLDISYMGTIGHSTVLPLFLGGYGTLFNLGHRFYTFES